MFLALGFMGPERSVGQVCDVVWEAINAAHERPPGRAWTRVPGAFSTDANYYDYVDETLPGTYTQSTSMEDWLNCHVKLYEDGVHVGYVASGYSWLANYTHSSNACSPQPEERLIGPQFNRLWEDQDRWQGSQYLTVARFDLDGNVVWYRAYHSGQSFGLIQDSNGDIVVCGETSDSGPITSTTGAMAPWSEQPIYLDPTTQAQVDMATTDCEGAKQQMLVDKLDLEGNVIWSHAFTSSSLLPPGVNPRSLRTFPKSIVETKVDGQLGYRLVGLADIYVDLATDPSNIKARPFMVDLDVNGMLNWKKTFDLGFNAYISAEAWYIQRTPDPNSERYVVCGTGYRSGNTAQSAWLMYFDEDDAQNPEWVRDTYSDNSLFPGVQTNMQQLTTRVIFISEGSNTFIAWPILTNFYGVTYASWNHEATGRLFKLDLMGDPAVGFTPTDLGIMRGYEIHLSAVQSLDGDLILASTKRPGPWSIANPFTWNDVDPFIKHCLVGTDPDPFVADGYWDFDRDGPAGPFGAFDWQTFASNPDNIGNWQSESYVAKVSSTSGNVLWDFQWDESTPVTSCWPDNLRQRQCTFMVTEDADGSIVVCGNTGHSADDGYLAKIHYSCEGDPALYTAFHALHPYDPSNVYTVTGTSETWSSSMNVRGSFVIPAGKTLTINNNAVISFADSRRIGYTTNIVVEPGGKLRVMGGARLTNIAPCGDGMWDGIMALGQTSLAQTTVNQADVQITSGATIENAFVAVLAANADINDPITSTATQRGARVICTNATFKNNIYDVVLRPYTTSDGSTVTKAWECDFLTTGPLNYPDKTPKIHLYANAYPRLNINGCTFDGTHIGLDENNVAAWGKGIESFNTDLRINPYNGRDPHFNSLESGCFAANPNAKNVWVDGAYFDGCGHSLGIVASGNARVINCDFKEPDLDMVGQGLGAPVYGTYLEETPTILFENNAFVADGSPFSNPCVGSTFKDLGPNDNTFFNNTYSGFTGTNGAQYSAGVTIQGVNDGNAFGDGLKFKCNDFSFGGAQWADDFDMAFTGPNVSVAGIQGSDAAADAPAGNTFLMNCTGEAHMKVDDVPNNGTLYFQYWHHTWDATTQVVPTCLTNPPLVPYSTVVPPFPPTPGTINFDAGLQYSKSTACGGGAMMLMAGGGSGVAAQVINAANEIATLKAVYDDWTDGGNTDGLKDLVMDPSQSSYTVRNQLMLVAPKVSSEVWHLVFERNPVMSPWHLAQALIANSPLEPEVYKMMDASNLTPYYKQLVANQQNGISMQTIMESELAYWEGEQSQALMAYSAMAMDELPTVSFTDAIALQQQYPTTGSAQQIYLLHLAAGDMAGARAALNSALSDEHTAWWDVQDIYLAKLELGVSSDDLSMGEQAQLSAIATNGGTGAVTAAAWLAAETGAAPTVDVILPGTGTRAFMGGAAGLATPAREMLGVYPNPTKGQAYITYELPEGAEQGQLIVYDATGRLVLSNGLQRSGGIVEMPRSLLAPGVYSVSLSADDIQLVTVKFIALR